MTASERGASSRRSRTLKLVPWLLTAALMLVSASPTFDVAFHGVVPVVQSLSWVWLILGVVGIVTAVELRLRLIAGLCVLAVLLAGWPLFALAAPASCPTGEPEVSVFSLNARVASADVDQVRREILARNVDIAILVEVDEPMLDELRSAKVVRQLPYVSHPPSPGGGTGSVIMTRFPQVAVASARTFGGPEFNFDQPAIRVDVRGVDVLVHAVHTFPPIASGAGPWRQTLRSLGRWQRDHRDEPTLLAGDFNASRAHPAFRYAATGMDDASRAAGRVSLPTWPVGSVVPPFVTLDHILTRSFSADSFERIRIDGTDHQAIAARVRICSQ